MKASKKMLSRLLLSFSLSLSGLIGCASVKKSVTLGVLTGASAGGISGTMIAQRRQGEAAAIMGLIAALVGGASGFFIHKGIEKEGKRIRRQTLLNLQHYGAEPGESTPTVTAPVVEEYEIQAKVEGQKLIGPHKVWKIREAARWRLDGRENKKKKEVLND